jgi:DNA-binding NarL/FixJ family response regulator
LGKDADSTSVITAVERVLKGYSHFAAEPGPALPRHASTAPPRGGSGNPFGALSPREAEVLRGLVAGRSLVHLSHSMGVNNKTLSTYRKRLLTKLGVTSNAELLTLAILHGLQ